MRNALAHGDIIIDYEGNKVILRYYNSQANKKEDVILSPDFFKTLHTKISTLVLNFWSGVANAPIILTNDKNEI